MSAYTFLKNILSIFILFSTPLYASLSNQPPSFSSNTPEIIVQLETDCRQIPLYLTEPHVENGLIAPSYLSALDSVLRFDFTSSAFCQLLDVQQEREVHAKALFQSPQKEQGYWKKQGAHYLITPLIKDQTIALQLSDLNTLNLQTTPFIALKGNLEEDRTLLHKLSETLHEAITGVPGIATTRIIYTIKKQKSGSDWSSEVWESDYDGGNPRKIITGEDYCLHPVYVPPREGERVKTFLYVGYCGGQPRLLYASRQEGKGYRVSQLKGIQLTPAISWQRDRIAFVCDVKGSPDLFVQTFDPLTGKSEDPKRLFHVDGASQSSPYFHPNGDALTFTSDKNGTPQVYVLSLAESRKPPQLISRRARNGSGSVFSPDGSKIAFSAKTDGVRQIWVYDCALREEQQITFSPGNKENPSWAPDSLHIVYNGTSPNDYELYFLDLNKMKPVRIPTQVGEKRFPNWELRLLPTNPSFNPL